MVFSLKIEHAMGAAGFACAFPLAPAAFA